MLFKLFGDFSCAGISFIRMNDKRKCVYHIAIEHNINLNKIAAPVFRNLIIKRCIASCARFERIKEIINYFIKRQFIADINSVGRDISHRFKYAAPVLAHIHNRAHKFTGRIDIGIAKRLLAIINQRGIGIICGIIYFTHRAVCHMDFINNARHGGNKIKIIFSFEPFLNDFKMQQPEKAATKAEAERTGRKRGIVELQLFKSITQSLIIRTVCRINTAEHHGIYFFITRKRLFCRISSGCYSIADTGIMHRFD